MAKAKAKAKQKDPTKPFPAPGEKTTGKKKPDKITIMLMKAMPGVSMPPKKGAVTPMPKKTTSKSTKKSTSKKPC